MTSQATPAVLVEIVVPAESMVVELGVPGPPGPPGPPGESESQQYDTDLVLIYQTAKL